MNKFLKWSLITIVLLIVVGFIAFRVMQANTKQHSPEQSVVLEEGDLRVEVFYNRPYKKGREIFGDLVPYDITWRTGANEATTFSTNIPLLIGSRQTLPPGEYTLWTIPGANEWRVIWNEKSYSWGVDWNEVASRQPEFDLVEVTVPVEQTEELVEQFTIRLEKEPYRMILEWDRTRVTVEMTPV